MFFCKEIIICFLFLLEKITCSVTNDKSNISYIETNRKIKEHIDKIANNYIINRDNFLNFKNCIECVILRNKRRFGSPNNLSEERKEFLLNSTIEILKRGFDLDKIILYFSEDYTEVNTNSESKFHKNLNYWLYSAKRCIYQLEFEVLKKFYRICIEGTKPIIENYMLTQSSNKKEMNNCYREIEKKSKEFLDNDDYTHFISHLRSRFCVFYARGESFCNIWTKCSDELKYRLIFGYKCVNLKKKEIKFNETLICNKIREIKEMCDYIINYHINLKNPDYSIENNQKCTQTMEFFYNTELILQKCKILYQFVNENKSNIIKTYYNKDKIIEKTVSEENINKYLNEIEFISNKIKNDHQLKGTIKNIWHYLMIMLSVKETILDDFLEKKRNQIMLLCEEGYKIMFNLMAKFFEIDDMTFKNVYVEIFDYKEKQTLFSKIEYDYCYLTPYFFSFDFFSDFKVIILLEKFRYYNIHIHRYKVENVSNSIFNKKFKIIKKKMLDLKLLPLAVNELEKNLPETKLWFLQNYNWWKQNMI